MGSIFALVSVGCSGGQKGAGKPGKGARAPVSTSPPAARAAPAKRVAAHRPQLVTHYLLDDKLEIAPPARLERYWNILKSRHWRISGFRYSKLPKALRRMEALVTFRYRRTRYWLTHRNEPLVPQARAYGGQLGLHLGKRKRWPFSTGVYETLRSLLLFGGTSVGVQVDVPRRRAALSFALGLSALGRGTVAPKIVVTLTADSKTTPLLEHQQGPIRGAQWRSVQLSLARWAGKRVTLRFAVHGHPDKLIGPLVLGEPAVIGEATDRKPNLIVLVIDTARPDALSCYAGRRTSTPQVDALAKRGALFENAFTNASWTRASLMSLMSSRSAGKVGSTPWRFRSSKSDDYYIQHGKLPTLYSHLEAQGYLTRGLLNNFFMLPHERVGHDHGLSSFAHIWWGQGPKRKDNPTLSKAVEAFLQRNHDRRFFLYLIYESAHSPYTPPRSAKERMRKLLGIGKRKRLRAMERYRAEVIAIDDHVGRVMRALDRNKLTNDTIVVITSDHGEIIGRQHCFFIPRMKYRTCHSHSVSLYDQVLRIPVVIAGPGVKPGRRVTQIYEHVDLVPTLLSLMGLPPMRTAEGWNLADYLRADKPPATKPRDVFATGRAVWAVRTGRYKLIFRAPWASKLVKNGRPMHRPVELYDLQTDPDEMWNLAKRKPEIVARLRPKLEAYIQSDFTPELPDMPRYLKKEWRFLHERVASVKLVRPRPVNKGRRHRSPGFGDAPLN